MSDMGSHDIRNERPRTWYICDECGAEYSSFKAAVACEDDDRANGYGK